MDRWDWYWLAAAINPNHKASERCVSTFLPPWFIVRSLAIKLLYLSAKSKYVWNVVVVKQWWVSFSFRQLVATWAVDAPVKCVYSVNQMWFCITNVVDFLTSVRLYVSSFYSDTVIFCCYLSRPDMCLRWPRQRACLRWSSTTPRCRPRYPPSRSLRPTQATPSPCPPPLPPITEKTTSRCYDALMYVHKFSTYIPGTVMWLEQQGDTVPSVYRIRLVMFCISFIVKKSHPGM